MYYIDGTRYDQVDGTGSVVPSVKEDGTRYLVPSSRSPEHQVGQGQSRLPGIPDPGRD